MNRFWRFVKHMFLPPFDAEWVRKRLEAEPDLPWQPFLSTAVFYGAVFSLFAGSTLNPPGGDLGVFDFIWIIAALTSPLLGFVAVWLIKHTDGRLRYFALWLRLAANIGMATALLDFLVQHWVTGIAHPFGSLVVSASALFVVVLIVRDVRFLVWTERLANELIREEVGCEPQMLSKALRHLA